MRLVIKDHKCISVCYERGFMCNFHQLKDKSRNKCAYKGISIIEEEDCFWVEIEIFEKRIFCNLSSIYNPGQKSLGQYSNVHIFLSFLGSLLNQCILFEIFLRFFLPPTLYKVETWKKIWIHASNIVCGVRGGVGPVWTGNRPRNARVFQDFPPWL